MDYMDSGLRYTPNKEKEWESAVQFLPASDNKKLEKKKGPGKVGAVIGVVIFAAVVALMAGLLVWHFHIRKDIKVTRIYTGSLRITNQVFEDAYENSKSPEFNALAKQVTNQLKLIYSKTPQLAKYYVNSSVQAFSEGSVIAYYLSVFNVPAGQEAAVDRAMTSINQQVNKERSTFNRPGNALMLENVVTSALDTRMLATSFNESKRNEVHARTNERKTIQSPEFPNIPYRPNMVMYWQLRADPGYVIKLDFDTIHLEENCTNDFVKIYDSLLPMKSRIMDELCGHFSPSEPMTFLSSGNVMFVAMATNDKRNYPGFRAYVTQVKHGSKGTTCGGQLSGEMGSFTSPNFPNYYPPNTKCQWVITVPKGKAVKVTFKKIILQKTRICDKDYVEINGKKVCGEKGMERITETSKDNEMTIIFNSDESYVDQGFDAVYEAIDMKDPCPKQFECKNKNCIKSDLRCNGRNDCGDMSDELNCKCKSEDITCRNGFCKAAFLKCDGTDDCGDRTDESNCVGCPVGKLQCKNKKCVSEKRRCDGRDDCGDGTDELQCDRGSGVTCTDKTYKCKNNKCISKVNPECDGQNDCEDGSDEENCNCGQCAFKTSRIVGGVEASKGEFPWLTSLHPKNHGHVCGASLISPKWLVTAAHCVQDSVQIRLSKPDAWDAVLGLHTQSPMDSTAVKRKIKQIIPHPYYNVFTYDYDIALMELDSAVTYTDYISPICLPPAQFTLDAESSVRIAGWGTIREGGSGANVLQKADVRIIDHNKCSDLMPGQLTSRMTCAGYLTGAIDACQGDSGGPLCFLSGTHWVLAGVVSWGDGCARENKPGVYTDIRMFRDWIKQRTGV